MQLLGAWMMRAPLARAFVRNSFMRGASSFSRMTAFRQWCESHMSQTMTAVLCRSQVAAFRLT